MWERIADLTDGFAYRIGRRLVSAGEKQGHAIVKPWERADWWKSWLRNELGEVPEDWSDRLQLERQGGISLLGFRAAMLDILGLKKCTQATQDIDELFICFDARASLNGSGLIPLHVIAADIKRFTEHARVSVPGSRQNVAAQHALWAAEGERRRALAAAEAELAALEAFAQAQLRAREDFWQSPEGVRQRGQRQRFRAGGVDMNRHGFGSVAEVRRFFGASSLNGLGGCQTSLRQASLRQEAPEIIGGTAIPTSKSSGPASGPASNPRVLHSRELLAPRRRGQQVPLEGISSADEADVCYLILAAPLRRAGGELPPRHALSTLHELDA